MWGYFFHWWQGSIWGNLIASLIWAIPAYLFGRFHFKKMHKRLDKQDDKMETMHNHIKEVHSTVTNNQGDSSYGN